jgi:hypothetical protein
MNEYSPFLKFKENEIRALKYLSSEDRKNIVPLLELSRDDKYTEDILVSRINRYLKKLKNGIEPEFTFYIDNYEVPDNIKIKGNDSYLYLVNAFSEFNIIPVIGFDRLDTHNEIGINYANKVAKIIALRVTQDYFENFLAYKNDLKNLISMLNSDTSCILLIDCNYLDNTIIEKRKTNIMKLLENKSDLSIFSKIVICGSSIPNSIGEVVKTDTDKTINRNEILIYKEIKKYFPDLKIIFGDYTIVSPGYSEINITLEAMFNVMTPKIIYSFSNSHYVSRGKSIKKHGYEQYFKQAEAILKKTFYRGRDFSWGDNYLYERVKYKAKKITPGTIIGPTVNAHIKYMIDEILKGSI